MLAIPFLNSNQKVLLEAEPEKSQRLGNSGSSHVCGQTSQGSLCKLLTDDDNCSSRVNASCSVQKYNPIWAMWVFIKIGLALNHALLG